MIKYFKWSYIVAIIGMLCAYFWGEMKIPGSGLKDIFIVFVLSILEISLSFDNAVINATKLQKMAHQWCTIFLTWGILIAVFGMRLLFPIAIVSVFSGLGFMETLNITFNDVDKYTHYLELANPMILTFGGSFLMMLFLHYFFNTEKEIHWIKVLEEKISHFGHVKGIETVITLLILIGVQHFASAETKLPLLISGISGIILYILIDGISRFMEMKDETRIHEGIVKQTFKAGLISFCYLELIDASFSLDGVLGAFALSKDIIIIMLGLGIGAMFVRSFTIMLVEKQTLKQLIYLEHGAHWAIGTLALIMFTSTKVEVPEVITGLIGLIFIVTAYISSVRKNKTEQG